MKRQDLKNFIEILTENKDLEMPNKDLELPNEDSNYKEEVSTQLASYAVNNNISEEASKLLNQLSSTPQTWSSIYNAIEKFRNDTRVRDKFNNTANPTQIGMASVLHVLFQLVLETNFLIEPVDTQIIINTFKNNFVSEEHLEALRTIVEDLT